MEPKNKDLLEKVQNFTDHLKAYYDTYKKNN